MTNNIKTTKKKLSIMFSIIVFVVILSLLISLFSVKYFTEITREKKGIKVLSDIIYSQDNSVSRIKKMGERFDRSYFGIKDIPINKHLDKEELPGGFVNYIHLTNENILIGTNFKENIKLDLINDILEKDKYFKLKQNGGFLLQKFDIENGEKLIVFKKLRYSFNDYLTDVFGFIFVSLLFSILIYLIGSKFVERIFIPVEVNISDMKNFIHNAGHELKTPISVIDSNLQILSDTKKYDSSMNNEMRLEIKKLNSLIDSLVNLSDLDSFKKIDNNNLSEILFEIEKSYQNKISDKQIKLNIKIAKDITVKANKDYFYIFLSNIIGNAIKYNKKGGKIDISFKKGELTISDSGVGIKEENIEKIFDRFYKIDSSRNSEGFGIGLSLVKKIADIYKWKVLVESEENRGSSFKIKL